MSDKEVEHLKQRAQDIVDHYNKKWSESNINPTQQEIMDAQAVLNEYWSRAMPILVEKSKREVPKVIIGFTPNGLR